MVSFRHEPEDQKVSLLLMCDSCGKTEELVLNVETLNWLEFDNGKVMAHACSPDCMERINYQGILIRKKHGVAHSTSN